MLHSFHLAELPPRTTSRALLRPPRAGVVPGMKHAETLAMMRLGSPTVSLERMQLRRLAVFCAWEDEAALEAFLATQPLGQQLATGWHVRLQFLRRYGEVAALAPLPQKAGDWDPEEPIVAVTLARLRLREMPRFLSWGKPVERLVAGHPAAVFSTAAMRPPHTFSTFSIWRTVREMTEMVHGRSEGVGEQPAHTVAMAEQRRREFHHESAFMRFRPLSEHGTWQGRTLLP
ncbi:hypothetical protein [Nocardioides sp. WS12]|uniref:hypothetical protein n=1 Tax=Nocardioides sp. WS12 TaxID=2486272 RepID=UPI0015FA6226|nr:hypothetical protein [Nocardioides sp. WS12]